MRRACTPSWLMGAIGPPIIGVLIAWTLCRIPHQIVEFAMIWLLLSVPTALLFGHCVLDDDVS